MISGPADGLLTSAQVDGLFAAYAAALRGFLTMARCAGTAADASDPKSPWSTDLDILPRDHLNRVLAWNLSVLDEAWFKVKKSGYGFLWRPLLGSVNHARLGDRSYAGFQWSCCIYDAIAERWGFTREVVTEYGHSTKSGRLIPPPPNADWYVAWTIEGAELRALEFALELFGFESGRVGTEGTVTLAQAAAWAGIQPGTLAKYKGKGLPDPLEPGGHGRFAVFPWPQMRLFLMRKWPRRDGYPERFSPATSGPRRKADGNLTAT